MYHSRHRKSLNTEAFKDYGSCKIHNENELKSKKYRHSTEALREINVSNPILRTNLCSRSRTSDTYKKVPEVNNQDGIITFTKKVGTYQLIAYTIGRSQPTELADTKWSPEGDRWKFAYPSLFMKENVITYADGANLAARQFASNIRGKIQSGMFWNTKPIELASLSIMSGFTDPNKKIHLLKDDIVRIQLVICAIATKSYTKDSKIIPDRRGRMFLYDCELMKKEDTQSKKWKINLVLRETANKTKSVQLNHFWKTKSFPSDSSAYLTMIDTLKLDMPWLSFTTTSNGNITGIWYRDPVLDSKASYVSMLIFDLAIDLEPHELWVVMNALQSDTVERLEDGIDHGFGWDELDGITQDFYVSMAKKIKQKNRDLLTEAKPYRLNKRALI